jgi:CIC family chloride channel protein
MELKKISLTSRVISWRLKHLSGKQFILIMSIAIGFLAGLAAVVIKNSVHFISHWVEHNILSSGNTLWLIGLPSLGIFLAVAFIKFVIRRPVRHGVPNVLYAISKKQWFDKPAQYVFFSNCQCFNCWFGWVGRA